MTYPQRETLRRMAIEARRLGLRGIIDYDIGVTFIEPTPGRVDIEVVPLSATGDQELESWDWLIGLVADQFDRIPITAPEPDESSVDVHARELQYAEAFCRYVAKNPPPKP